jgi:hypothetical protein
MAQKIQKVRVIRPSIIETELIAIGRVIVGIILFIVVIVAAWHAHENGSNSGNTSPNQSPATSGNATHVKCGWCLTKP